MKKILTFLVFVLLYANGQAAVKASWAEDFKNNPEVQALTPEMFEMGMEQFLSLTPKKYKELTGERLGLKKTLQLKAAQKFIVKKTKSDPEFTKGIYILLAILGLGWLAMGIMDDWNGSTWLVNLILVILCWLPGLIHALVKMNDYYPDSN